MSEELYDQALAFSLLLWKMQRLQHGAEFPHLLLLLYLLLQLLEEFYEEINAVFFFAFTFRSISLKCFSASLLGSWGKRLYLLLLGLVT